MPRFPFRFAVLALSGLLACLAPIHSSDLECAREGCPDAAAGSDALPVFVDGGAVDAGAVTDALVPSDAGTSDASAGADAQLEGDASCRRLFTLSYPGGDLLDVRCVRDVARFRLGPCPAGDDCRIDSRAFFPAPDGGWVESVTAAGRRWDFDLGSGQLVGPTAGTDLAGEPHLAEGTTGACAGKASGGCVPEARTYRPDLDAEVLVVPRAGAVAYWAYGALSHTPLTLAAPPNGSDLTGFPRFLISGGPCSGKTVATCHLESLAYVSHGGVTREFVSAYGSLWEFSLPSSAQLSAGKLQTIARFQATACPGPGDCRIRAHAFQPLPDGGFAESFSE